VLWRWDHSNPSDTPVPMSDFEWPYLMGAGDVVFTVSCLEGCWHANLGG